MLYTHKTVSYNKNTIDRRTYNSTTPADITDDNLDDRIDAFQYQIKIEFVYRIPVRYFPDIGKINFPLKIDFKTKCHLELEMTKLFESKKKVNAMGSLDAKIFFTKVPFIQYEQFLLDKNFRQYCETIMISKIILRMGIQTYKMSVGNKYKMFIGSGSIYFEFFRANR